MFYDLAVIGLAFVLRERTANLLIFVSLFGNPVDLARVASLLTLSDPSIFGAAGAALLKFLGGAARSYAALALGLSVWLVVPLALAARVLRRLDL
jgi:Cu-processing system permease protein